MIVFRLVQSMVYLFDRPILPSNDKGKELSSVIMALSLFFMFLWDFVAFFCNLRVFFLTFVLWPQAHRTNYSKAYLYSYSNNIYVVRQYCCMTLCEPAATELKIKKRSRIARMQRSLFTDSFFDFSFDLSFDFLLIRIVP